MVLDALKRVGFDPSRRTFVLWEGVTYYLQAEAVEATLQTVAHYLARWSGFGSVEAQSGNEALRVLAGETPALQRIPVIT
ncbi:MAG: class I SAM-dependent methyltransferase [Chloroflexaceae bacterium]|nr:class I SAM-dependent methyltransferase [Chloroflexaceae bacterium]